MPPQHSTGYGSTQWSTGCGGGIPGQPVLPPSQTCQQPGATLLTRLLAALGHDIPDRHENAEDKMSFRICRVINRWFWTTTFLPTCEKWNIIEWLWIGFRLLGCCCLDVTRYLPSAPPHYYGPLVVRGRAHTFGMPTQMFRISNFSGSSICVERGGIVVESFLSRPWSVPV